MGRAWRNGLTDVALGAAGIEPFRDHRGEIDPYGNELQLTQMAVVDELAAAGELVKGKCDQVPVAVVRGYPGAGTAADGPGAVALLRDAASDMFSLGTAEARAAGLRDGRDPARRRRRRRRRGRPARRRAAAATVAGALARWPTVDGRACPGRSTAPARCAALRRRPTPAGADRASAPTCTGSARPGRRGPRRRAVDRPATHGVAADGRPSRADVARDGGDDPATTTPCESLSRMDRRHLGGGRPARKRTLDLLGAGPVALTRAHRAGHVTASALDRRRAAPGAALPARAARHVDAGRRPLRAGRPAPSPRRRCARPPRSPASPACGSTRTRSTSTSTRSAAPARRRPAEPSTTTTCASSPSAPPGAVEQVSDESAALAWFTPGRPAHPLAAPPSRWCPAARRSRRIAQP